MEPGDDTANDGESLLIAAARRRFGTDIAAVPDNTRLRLTTTIPRSVGLAGSSAIVLAALRCLAELTQTPLAPLDLAQLAHMVEREDLGIAGGWQDQIVQACDVPLLMTFSEPMTQTQIAPASIPMFLAWSTAQSQASGDSHAELRSRSHDAETATGALTACAQQAATAATSGAIHDLKNAMNRTFDLRASIMPIDPNHRSMIDAARGAGAACNFTGSGGAIIGVVPKDPLPLWAALGTNGLEVLAFDLDRTDAAAAIAPR